jgi:hypothetical protein
MINKYQKITKCNWVDLETMGSPLVMPKTMDGENQPLVRDELLELEKTTS